MGTYTFIQCVQIHLTLIMQFLLSDAPLKAKHVTVILQCNNVIYARSCAKQVSILHWDATICPSISVYMAAETSGIQN